MKAGVLLGCIATAIGCTNPQDSGPVSLVALIANPNEFDNRVVSASGYLDVGAGLYLFLSKDHAQALDHESGVSIIDDQNGNLWKSDCVSHFVTITGTFFLDEGAKIKTMKDIQTVRAANSNRICFKAIDV